MELTLVLAGVIVIMFGVGAHSLTLDGVDLIADGSNDVSGYGRWI